MIWKESGGHGVSERGDDHEFTKLQGGRRHAATEGRQVVLVAMTDLLDEAVGAQAREGPRQLRGREGGEVWAEMAGVKATDREFAAQERLEQSEVIAVKQIEASMAPGGARPDRARCCDVKGGSRSPESWTS